MKTFPVCLLFTTALTFKCTFGQEQPTVAHSICSGITYGVLPDPTNCQKYYVCIQTKATHNSCPPDFVFRPNVSFCVHRTQYPCSTTEPATSTAANPETTSNSDPITEHPSTPSECPETPWEAHFCRNHISDLIRNPVNCTQYINCESSPPRNQECPSGGVFSLSYQDCFPGNPRTCELDPVESNFCTDRPAGNYPHPYLCNRFVTCFRGELRVEICPPYYLFDRAAQRCIRGDVQQCSSLVG
ncbi:probable endochitinase [Topomyia yanbarensis]|uniref:probable endochitinase n=1 Tax=Topomyia yanbarensis TaxID=2498891 RepID=UPI00273C6D49|nr:probable endochitinase [Topomyia yanbarensis]